MSQTIQIMIDDTDPSISYTGNWIADKGSADNTGNGGPPYMSTNHYITGTGSFSFTFSGIYVGVFGTTRDGTDPVRTCQVDGVTIPNNKLSGAVNGMMHCQVNFLEDKQHTLVVTVPSPNAAGYWFDNVMYIPSASISMANAVLTIENGDPSMAYGEGWVQHAPGMIATSNGATFNMKFTGRHLAWLGYYLSGLPFAATTATYSIDNGSPVTFSLNGVGSQQTGALFNQKFFETGLLPPGEHSLQVVYNGNSNTTPLSIYNVLVQNGNSATGGSSSGGTVGGGSSGSGGGAGSGPATVTVTNSNTPTTPVVGGTAANPTVTPQHSSVTVIGTGESAVTVTVPAGNGTATEGVANGTVISGAVPTVTVTGAAPGSSNTSAPGAGTSSSDTGSNSPVGNSGTTNTSGAAASDKHSNIGLIIGVVVGVLALLLLIFGVLFIRRRRRNQKAHFSTGLDTAAVTVQPFTDPPSTPMWMSEVTSSSVGHPSSASESGSASFNPGPVIAGRNAYPSEKRQPTTSHAVHRSPYALSRSSSVALSSHPSVSEAADSTSSILLHQDSGVRLPLMQSSGAQGTHKIVEELPPTYSAD